MIKFKDFWTAEAVDAAAGQVVQVYKYFAVLVLGRDRQLLEHPFVELPATHAVLVAHSHGGELHLRLVQEIHLEINER